MAARAVTLRRRERMCGGREARKGGRVEGG